MTTTRQLETVQTAYRSMVYPFAPHLTTAVTLTLKLNARIRVARFDNVAGEYFEFRQKLTDEIISSTLRRFVCRLTHYLYGNDAKHRGKRHCAKPLVIASIEGRMTGKQPHLHLAVGNVPADKQTQIADYIARAWTDCDFGNKHMCVKPLSNTYGWLDYMTKEIGYADTDVLAVEHLSIPEICQRSI
jgi:hypothetical protein